MLVFYLLWRMLPPMMLGMNSPFDLPKAHASSHDAWDELLLLTSALCLKQSFLGMFPQRKKLSKRTMFIITIVSKL
jgi:hypothetical protein